LSYNNDTSLIHSDVADRLHKNVIVLPCSMTLDADQIKFICDTLLDLIQQHRNAKEYNIVEALEFPMATSRIEKFYRNLNEGAKGFRYFDKRKFDVIQTHLSTPLLVVDGEIVGYGHLDPDGDDVWLGICLSDGVVGQGWGKVLMGELLRTASKIDIRSIVLQVNRDNETAIRLYRSFGFKAVPGDRTLPSITMKLER
jgi:GNAT superfamily N-acetyltransferase